MSERLRETVDDLLGVIKLASIYVENNMVGNGRITGEEIHSYINVVWAYMENIADIPIGDRDKQRVVGSVHRSITTRRESLRPDNKYLSRDREVHDDWFNANRDAIAEYFLAAERIAKVFDPSYKTGKFDRKKLGLGTRRLVGSGRYKKPF